MREIPAEVVKWMRTSRRRGDLDRVAIMRGAIALAVIVGLSACGGSSSKSQTAASSPTVHTAPATATASSTPAATLAHDKFVAKLDAICTRGNAISAPYSVEAGNAANAGDFPRAAAALQQSKQHTAKLARELDNLTPPASDQAAFARYQTARHQIDNLTDQVIVALRARNSKEVTRLLAQNDSVRRERTAAAVALGSKRCGK